MKELPEEQKQERYRTVQQQIGDELQAMSHKYDAKLLAIVMFYQAVQLFRCVHSLGIWPMKEVEVFTTEASKDLLIPLPRDQLPQQAILTPDGVQPVTPQRKFS